MPKMCAHVPLAAQMNRCQGRLLLTQDACVGCALPAYQRAADALSCKTSSSTGLTAQQRNGCQTQYPRLGGAGFRHWDLRTSNIMEHTVIEGRPPPRTGKDDEGTVRPRWAATYICWWQSLSRCASRYLSAGKSRWTALLMICVWQSVQVCAARWPIMHTVAACREQRLLSREQRPVADCAGVPASTSTAHH